MFAEERCAAAYPDRGWERVYRDLWKYDSTFTFLCAPNDTHNCILNAYVRSGVVTRIGPTMKYGLATDLAGHATRLEVFECRQDRCTIEVGSIAGSGATDLLHAP